MTSSSNWPQFLLIIVLMNFTSSVFAAESACLELFQEANLAEGALFCEQNKAWRNFAGTVKNRPALFVEPQTEAQVASIVKAAYRLNLRVRPVGSGHSWSKFTQTNEILMGTHQLKSAIKIKDNGRKMTFTAAAGTRLRDAVAALRLKGYAVQNLGSTMSQTLGGVVSTNTHGTGVTKPGFAGLVESLRMVDGMGNIRVASATKNRELFRSVLAGAGMVGVITEITFRIEKDFYLSESKQFVNVKKLFQQSSFRQYLAENEWFSLLWPIHAKNATVLIRNRIGEDQTKVKFSWQRKRKGTNRGMDFVRTGGLHKVDPDIASLGRNVVTNKFVSLLANDPDTWEGIFNTFYRLVPAFTSAVPSNYYYSEALSDTFEVEEWDWNIETEIFFPIEFVPQYIQALQAYAKQMKKEKIALVAPFVGLRFVKGDHNYLSQTYIHKGYDKFVAVTLYDHDLTHYGTRWFKDNLKILHKIINDPTLIRMHLGKIYHDSEGHFHKRFHHWDKFKAARNASDPKGIFLNQWTEKFFQ